MHRRSQPIEILAHAKTSRKKETLHNVSYDPDKANEEKLNHNAAYDFVQVAYFSLLQTYNQHHVLATTKLICLLAIKPRALPLNLHCNLSVHETMSISPSRPFYILISNVFRHQARLSKYMIIANTVALQVSFTQLFQ